MSSKTPSAQPHVQFVAFNRGTAIIVGILLLIVVAATVLLLFTPVSYTTDDPASRVWLVQYILAPSVLLLCGLAFYTLIAKRFLTRYVLVFIGLLTLSASLLVGYSLLSHNTPYLSCHYDPDINIQTDFVSHQVCVGNSADVSAYTIVSHPFIVSTVTIGAAMGVASLVRYLMISRNAQTR